MTGTPLDKLCIDTIRFLSVDAVEKAKSGHPGAPMGAAPMAYTLWDRFLKHNPADPAWPDRDRFVLSCGHASALLYSLLFLTGYDLSLDDIKSFRQWGSKTPGHPEYGVTPGVEATTGPLGQGISNAVGMAIAETRLAQHYNQPGHEIINHFTYVMASDGDMQEGVASEAASLAGTLRLGKLIVLYDDNGVSIEGKTGICFTENVGQRFQAYGWHVVGPIDGMDVAAVDDAIGRGRAETDRPSLVICRTVIGYGAPHKAGTAAAHGEPLGAEETQAAKKNLNWPYPQPFAVPDDALAHLREARDRGRQRHEEWRERMAAYRQAFPDKASMLEVDLSGDLPEGWDRDLGGLFKGQDKPMATRDASGRIMNEIKSHVRSLVGGAADLAPSTKTILKDAGDYACDSAGGSNLHFGIREHAMGAISNGMALHGGTIPYAGTFFVFYDYMRPPVRLAALMGLRVIFIFTHDSLGVGEDGPTHQPIEHLAGLRTVPGLVTIRPADAIETVDAWRAAMGRRHGPTALVLSRQNLPILDRSEMPATGSGGRGGYVLWQSGASSEVLLIGTGSEVAIALEAGKALKEKGVGVRVVSLPSWELFEAQPKDYRDSVLPPQVRRRVSIEAGSPFGWERYVGPEGVAIGLSRFGASAPGAVLYQKLGLTAERMAGEALRLVREGPGTW
jgi:transketolase